MKTLNDLLDPDEPEKEPKQAPFVFYSNTGNTVNFPLGTTLTAGSASSLTPRSHNKEVLARINELITYYNPDGKIHERTWPVSTDMKQIVKYLEELRDMFDE